MAEILQLRFAGVKQNHVIHYYGNVLNQGVPGNLEIESCQSTGSVPVNQENWRSLRGIANLAHEELDAGVAGNEEIMSLDTLLLSTPDAARHTRHYAIIYHVPADAERSAMSRSRQV